MMILTTVAESKREIHVGNPASAAMPQNALVKFASDLIARSIYFSNRELMNVYEPKARPAPKSKRLTTELKRY